MQKQARFTCGVVFNVASIIDVLTVLRISWANITVGTYFASLSLGSGEKSSLLNASCRLIELVEPRAFLPTGLGIVLGNFSRLGCHIDVISLGLQGQIGGDVCEGIAQVGQLDVY